MSGMLNSLLGNTITKVFQSSNIDEIMEKIEELIHGDPLVTTRAQIFRNRPSGDDMKIAEVTSGPNGTEYKAEKKSSIMASVVAEDNQKAYDSAVSKRSKPKPKAEFRVEMEITRPKVPELKIATINECETESGSSGSASGSANSASGSANSASGSANSASGSANSASASSASASSAALEVPQKRIIDEIDRQHYTFNKKCCCIHEPNCKCECPRQSRINHQENCGCKCKCFCGTKDEKKNMDYDLLLRDKIEHCQNLMEIFCDGYCRVCPSKFNARTVLPDVDSVIHMTSPLARNSKMQYKVMMSTLRKSIVNFNILHYEGGQLHNSCNNFSGFVRYGKDFNVADSTIMCAMYQYYLALRANTSKHDNAEVLQTIVKIPDFEFEPNVDYWLSGKITCRLIYKSKVERNHADGTICPEKIPRADKVELWFETTSVRKIEKPFVSICECENYELHNSLHKNSNEVYKPRSTLQLFYYRLMDYHHMPLFMEYHFVKPQILSSFDQMMQEMFSEDEVTPLSEKFLVFDADSMKMTPEDYVQIRDNLITTMKSSTFPSTREYAHVVEEARENTKLALAGKYKPKGQK
jgi:hypothetical protein